ncbi:hypothetical protein MD484_g5149, partial [Candolleomyces efflorescens]
MEPSDQPSAPDIVVRACGPSFSLPEAAFLGFSNIATFCNVRAVIDPIEISTQLAAMSVYAKYIFELQPNRFYVRSLLITLEEALVFHFDRSGAQHSLPFNIHEDPQSFVQLILGLCSTDERILGLDDSIQWTIGDDGTKMGGTLRTIGSDGQPVEYYLDEDPIVRSGIRGRGTTCWPVKDAKGERFMVKDYWVSGDREAEYELLKQAKGLPGVCQMVSYEACRAQTKYFRGDSSAFIKDAFRNRTAVRIVMKAYGLSIEDFSSVEQVLAALRDAISGHRALLGKDVVHRDISPNNILLGPPDAEEGERGALIDLDIALRLNAPFALIRADHNMGTRMFHSLMVLRTFQFAEEKLSAHDYLDDLESFFWVFSYLVLTYKSDGKRAPKSYLQNDLRNWGQDPLTALKAKFVFLDDESMDWEIKGLMDEGWKPCAELFSKFRTYMNTLARKKRRLVFESDSIREDGFPNRFSSLLENVDEHYDYILGLFDDTLKRIKEPPQAVPVSESTSAPVPPPSPVVSLSTVPNQIRSIPCQESSPSLYSDASSSVLPSTNLQRSSLVQSPAPFRNLKRRLGDTELDECYTESKRQCPSSRRGLWRAFFDPTLHVINSVYDYCFHWL